MNIIEALEAMKKGEILRVTNPENGESVFYVIVTMQPFGSQEMVTLETDEVRWWDKRPETFADMEFNRTSQVCWKTIVTEDFKIEPKERVLAIFQQAWDRAQEKRKDRAGN